MSVFLGVEDNREQRAVNPLIVGYCTDCGEDIYEEDYRVEFEHDYLCSCCCKKMSITELVAWFGGEFKRGL